MIPLDVDDAIEDVRYTLGECDSIIRLGFSTGLEAWSPKLLESIGVASLQDLPSGQLDILCAGSDALSRPKSPP